MNMKNAEVTGFYNFLMSFELIGKDSRMRTRFCKILQDRQNLINEEHAELIKQFAKFGEDGNPIEVFDADLGRKTYDVPDREGFQKEYYFLMDESFVIEENSERREMFSKIYELVLECDRAFKGKEALEYDRWCEIVESMDN